MVLKGIGTKPVRRVTHQKLELLEVSGLGRGLAPHFFLISMKRGCLRESQSVVVVNGEEKEVGGISGRLFFFGALASGSRDSEK